MDFSQFNQEQRFRSMWNSVRIVRPIPYTLFTFGDTDLQYFLVEEPDAPMGMVKVSRGKVDITRPLLITPYNSPPEFRNLWEDQEFSEMVDFLMSRTAAFRNLKIENKQLKSELTSDNVEEVVARLNRQLDSEDEDRIAILTAPANFGPLAILKLTTDRILESARGNIQELREHGFLPE